MSLGYPVSTRVLRLWWGYREELDYSLVQILIEVNDVISCYTVNSPQVGTLGLHCPLSMQVKVLFPCKT